MPRVTPPMDIALAPFTIIVDTREQAPFSFQGMHRDGAPLIVRTESRTLQSGDYSLAGFESAIAVERKSPEDLVQTLTHERRRFVAELERLQAMPFSVVIVEAPWAETLAPNPFRRYEPRTIWLGILALMQRFPRTHWIDCPSRRAAEVTTYQVLDRFWRDEQDGRHISTATIVATTAATMSPSHTATTTMSNTTAEPDHVSATTPEKTTQADLHAGPARKPHQPRRTAD